MSDFMHRTIIRKNAENTVLKQCKCCGLSELKNENDIPYIECTRRKSKVTPLEYCEFFIPAGRCIIEKIKEINRIGSLKARIESIFIESVP